MEIPQSRVRKFYVVEREGFYLGQAASFAIQRRSVAVRLGNTSNAQIEDLKLGQSPEMLQPVVRHPSAAQAQNAKLRKLLDRRQAGVVNVRTAEKNVRRLPSV